MQAVMETTFDLVYLISVITIGILMVRASSGKSRQFTIFGWMAIILSPDDGSRRRQTESWSRQQSHPR